MILEIRIRVVFPSRKEIKVLSIDRCMEILFPQVLLKKILKSAVDQLYCEYYEEGFVIQFK